MGIDDTLIQEIVRRILTVAKPDKIILFGSAATGPMTRDSDIDLLVVEPEIKDRQAEYVRISRALWEIDYPIDILVHHHRVVRGQQERHRRHRVSREQVRQGDL